VLQVKPAAADQVARIAQVGLLGPPVPEDLAAVDVLDPVRALEWVGLACDLHPPQPGLDLGRVGVGNSPVGPRFGLGVLQLDRHGLGQLVRALVVVLRPYLPVGSGLGLHAQDRVDAGFDEVGDERGLSALLQPLHHLGGELISVVVVGRPVGFTPPVGLVTDLHQELLDLSPRQGGVFEVFGGL
jgi:hypothetical protein